jgi:uncharacterized protein
MMGSSWNSRKALAKIATAYAILVAGSREVAATEGIEERGCPGCVAGKFALTSVLCHNRGAAETNPWADGARRMHYILFYDVVENFTEKRTPFRGAHLCFAREAFEKGELLLAGALADPPDGAVLVFRGASPEPAEDFARRDPYVTSGLVKSWRVRKWTTVIGDGATPPNV